ncbi:hypothetical protein PM082_007578 [Marasmius tenuissimus]|nr:hypothetical protein PM082_007578 [Marasmius tenuissimus]
MSVISENQDEMGRKGRSTNVIFDVNTTSTAVVIVEAIASRSSKNSLASRALELFAIKARNDYVRTQCQPWHAWRRDRLRPRTLDRTSSYQRQPKRATTDKLT